MIRKDIFKNSISDYLEIEIALLDESRPCLRYEAPINLIKFCKDWFRSKHVFFLRPVFFHRTDKKDTIPKLTSTNGSEFNSVSVLRDGPIKKCSDAT